MTDFAPDATLSYDEQIRRYAQVHARLMGNPAQKRVNKPTPEPEVRSEPVADNVIPFRRPLDIAGTMQQIAALAVAASPMPARMPDTPIAGHRLRFIIEHVAAFYRTSLIDLASARRANKIVRPRQIAMYLARKLTMFSLPQIGDRLGGKDHTTVLYGAKKIEAALGTDAVLAGEVAELVRRIEAQESPVVSPPDPPPAPKVVKPKKARKRERPIDLPKLVIPAFWDEKRDADLTKLWFEGVSSDDIGERWGKCRSAITDRARKIGLPSRKGHWQVIQEVPFS